MKIFHISLTQQGNDYVSLRYFWENPANYKEHKLPLAKIQRLSEKAETDYYTKLPEEYSKIGKALYNWLDNSDRLLASALKEPHPQGLIVAIATDKGLAHLPWELLHDGECFLVEKRPSIIPVRWVSNGKSITRTNSPQNRPLNLLFMATSPLEVEPELDYEAEEGQILEATKRTPLDLRVEESGWLEELGCVVGEYESDHFDVFHLTGHATYKDEKPCFLTEDEYGACIYSQAENIADTFKSSLPSLIFLSGCRTGYSSDGAVPSMAEELLNMGATAILAWGEKVLDTDASTASSEFYKELSQGRTVAQALSAFGGRQKYEGRRQKGKSSIKIKLLAFRHWGLKPHRLTVSTIGWGLNPHPIDLLPSAVCLLPSFNFRRLEIGGGGFNGGDG